MKPRWKIMLNYSIWVVLICTLLVLLSFIGTEQKQLRCNNLEVLILPENEHLFIGRDDIVNTITNGGDENTLRGQPVSTFDIGSLEDKLELNPYVQDAEVFIDILGNLKVEVQQRKPILRVQQSNGIAYYIDAEGIKMPLSANYTAHVVVATGNIKEWIRNIQDTLSTKEGKDIYQLAKYIDEQPFWKAMIEQIVVDQKREITLIPVIDDHKIMLGDISRVEEKLRHLKIFYEKGLTKMGWDKYKVINLKYTGQIVCEK